uniref:Adenylate kinase 7 n=2 Tax=Schistocephalus solidus TaxID=70667 RepID=A0A0X3PIK1_SCHSO
MNSGSIGQGFPPTSLDVEFHTEQKKRYLLLFFKDAWLNKKQLDVYGSGDNTVPTIHVKDLATLIQAVLEARPRTRYMVAKDSSQNTLGEIIGAISARFSTGEVRRMTPQEVDTLNLASRHEIDQLTMDVSLEATILKEEYQIQWRSEAGMVENMSMLAEEYLNSRNLKPLRLCVLGAPFVGKTTLAMELARHYGLHYIHIQAVILEVYTRLRKLIKAAKKGKTGEKRERTMPIMEKTPALLPTATSVDVADEHLGTPMVNTPAETTQTVSKISDLPDEKPSTPPPSEVVLMSRLSQDVSARYPFDPEITWETDEQLEVLASDAEEELKEFIRATSSDCRVDDALVINYLRRKLLSKPCQNQGFVLDGYPKTLEQAQLLFGPDTEDAEDPKNPQWNPLLTPERVIYLQASNSLVTHRFKQMFPPELSMEELEAPKQGLAFDPGAELAKRKKPASAQQADKKTLNRNLKKLKIDWELPEEEPQHRLIRRLEEYRARMAPQAAAEIIEALLAEVESQPKKKATAEATLEEALLPRKLLAPEVPDPAEKNVLTYFDLRELHPLVINMDADKTQLMKPNGPQKGAFEKAVKFIGPPTATATEYMRRAEGTFDEIARQAEEAAAEEDANYERRSEEASILLKQEEAIWADYLNLLKNENQERWETKDLPRRSYLLQYVLPKVTESLVLFGENRSQDPIDFLAEYLLRNSK